MINAIDDLGLVEPVVGRRGDQHRVGDRSGRREPLSRFPAHRGRSQILDARCGCRSGCLDGGGIRAVSCSGDWHRWDAAVRGSTAGARAAPLEGAALRSGCRDGPRRCGAHLLTDAFDQAVGGADCRFGIPSRLGERPVVGFVLVIGSADPCATRFGIRRARRRCRSIRVRPKARDPSRIDIGRDLVVTRTHRRLVGPAHGVSPSCSSAVRRRRRRQRRLPHGDPRRAVGRRAWPRRRAGRGGAGFVGRPASAYDGGATGWRATRPRLRQNSARPRPRPRAADSSGRTPHDRPPWRGR